MRQKTFSWLSPLFLLLLFFAPMIAKAGQLLGVSQDNPDWSEWKSAPNFPGIKIRVLCGTYVESTGNAQWSFQFQNTYTKKVYLVYQEEAGDSTGAPPKFSTPGGRNLGPGEKSDVYTDYLRGTCDSRKQIFIRIVSVSDDQGKQTQARAGASRSGSFNAPPQSSSTGGKRYTADVQSTSSQGQSGQAQSTPTSVSHATGQSVQPASGGVSGSVAGTTWNCHEAIDNTIATGGKVGIETNEYLITFNSDGSVRPIQLPPVGGMAWTSDGRWRQDGSIVKWSNWGTVESVEGGPAVDSVMMVMKVSSDVMQGTRVFNASLMAREIPRGGRFPTCRTECRLTSR